ncbi:sigma-70 family RNA polymerase sigma factor [Halobacillus sp. Marseille-Q1614]|uniref:sigma-70 family RNA polymerase sigma factor n=1 Tax=Halobacillus sp. Marseille-Q1614 TaxID=2709134 RepID=UPI0020C41ECB|nr:sigma-70 family RNA polymerase sigma factor [Halobacillus sp. Marseille-Q1614]
MESRRDEKLNEIVENYYASLLRTAFGYVKNMMTAEDMVQDALLKAYDKFHLFQEGQNLKAWVFKIMINHCKDYLRSYDSRKVTPWEGHWLQNTMANTKDPLDIMLEKEAHSHIHEAISHLRPGYHECVHLYYFNNLSVKQVSHVLHMNENTLKTRMKRARDYLGGELSLSVAAK